MSYTVHTIPAFDDNYLWLVADAQQRCIVVDPGDANAIQNALDDLGLTLSGILVTHHHPDHTGGISTLVERHGCPVYGPQSKNIPQVTHTLSQGDVLEVLGLSFDVMTVPGHTLDHIAYFCAEIDARPALFCGDTLFAGGCGRLFEGTAEQMHSSLSKLAELPDTTAVYCAHEYTQANLAFAIAVEPKNQALVERVQAVKQKRANNEATVPSTIGDELTTNPFMRSHIGDVKLAAQTQLGHAPSNDVETLRAIRGWKDNF